MKKLLKISFLLAVLSLPVLAEGDLPTGNRNCQQNCGLYEQSSDPTKNTDDRKIEESVIEEIYSWMYEQISDFVG